ncbi:SUMO-activating enzyme subunit 1B-1-like protein [Cinnamomum micranthum f. kanehirae]|uniref:SUMO-activating enzyme subunit 1B-1-like protein n=1 Tax=Cinnamomum micranthum f. kanehirae TaxID=337451 RepID=A0A3S5WGK4_9MAGN|nr:SUMO-activating enzyme subunit 1B-1-like protein [Cinnamomum micranthum f. kanehirae]
MKKEFMEKKSTFEADLILQELRLHIKMDGEELTAQETALYDRQIRVWGVDAQRSEPVSLEPFVHLPRTQLLEQRTSHTITILNTPLNILTLQSTLPPDSTIRLASLPFKGPDQSLPPNSENIDALPYLLVLHLCEASRSLKPSFHGFISSMDPLPLCIISDVFFGWTVEIANQLGIFHSFFLSSGGYDIAVYFSLWLNLPHSCTDSDEFLLPDFPEAGASHRSQLSNQLKSANGLDPWLLFLQQELSLCLGSDGFLFNTVEELEKTGLGLSKSHILVSGMNGTVAEFCKNIVLAGVGSLTLMDDRLVTEEDLLANFLIRPDEKEFGGRSLAEFCCDSLREFNPMVRVSVEKGKSCCDLSSFDGEFFDKFDAVVVARCSLAIKKVINAKCRKRSKGTQIAFYAVDCRDSCGEIFVDLQNYTYAQKSPDGTIDCLLKYPSFEEAITVPWQTLPKRTTKLYFAMRVIESFEQAEGRNPGETSLADLPTVLVLRKELCEAQSFNESQIPVGLLERLLAGTREYPPVCAILGGILGQEVIKAISGKGDPLKNFFLFDVVDGKGVIEDISNPTET